MAFTAISFPRVASSIARMTCSSKALASANRAANKAAKIHPPSRDVQITILQRIVEVLRERREKVLEMTGSMGRGLLKAIFSEQLKHFLWLTRHMMNHYIATRPDGQPIGTFIVTRINNETVVPGLTDSPPVARATRDDAVVMEPQPQQMPTPTDASTTATEATELTSKRGDRPLGSTVGPLNTQKTLVAEALKNCAIEIASLKCTAAEKSAKLGKCCQVPRGSYEKAVVRVCKNYILERSDISMETALYRTKVGRKLKVHHRGTYSPMIFIETHVLASIMRRAALHQPVSCGEGLELANSAIEGKHLQLALMELKKKNLKNGPNDETFGTLGPKYWQNFCRRNADVITSNNPSDSTIKDMIGDDWRFFRHV
jgi:hypothetical protein